MEKYTIDYSKWDRISENDSDNDDNDSINNDSNNDDGIPKGAPPQVTVFDQPTRVTFGGSGSGSGSGIHTHHHDNHHNNGEQPSSLPIFSTTTSVTPATTAATIKRPNVAATDEFGIPLSWTENGASVPYDSSLAKEEDDETTMLRMPNSASPQSPLRPIQYCYFWSQDRSMIHLRIPIEMSFQSPPPQKRKYYVQITNLLSFPDRHCATITTDSARQRLVVKSLSPSLPDNGHGTGNDLIVLEGTLTHPVYVPEDYDDDEVDWSIQEYQFPAGHNNRTETESGNGTAAINGIPALSFEKYILITLYKATPMLGMALWWKRCLTSETTDATIVRHGDTTQQQEAFQTAWRDAHEQFRQSMQSKPKYSL